MTYDFTTAVNRRGTGSEKWLDMEARKPDVAEDIFPMSVADLDMKMAPGIIDGLKKELDTMILGYIEEPTDDYYDSVIGWMKTQHKWDVKKEWVSQTTGLISSFLILIEAFTEEGEGVIIMDPVYYPFAQTIRESNRLVVNNTLINTAGYYTIDFEDLEVKAKDPNNKLLMLCSPHNPVGRVWTKEELVRIAEICQANDVIIYSDEIHFDIIMPEHEHIVLASISDEIAENVLTATAPSKTFNLAGLRTSNMIISNPDLQKIFTDQAAKMRLNSCNNLGLVACQYAYNTSADWKDEFVELIFKNYKVVKAILDEDLPQAVMTPLEGTYLVWIDLRAYDLSAEEIAQTNIEHDVFLDEGYVFGETGAGFVRLHIGTPTHIVEEVTRRLALGINKASKK